MRTKIWLVTVTTMEKSWYGVFDFEVSEERGIKESGLQNVITFDCDEVDHYREKRDPLAVLPEVEPGVLFALEKDLLEKHWLKNTFTLLSLNQPIIHEYLRMNSEKHGEIAAMIGLVVFRLIESQVEAEEMS